MKEGFLGMNSECRGAAEGNGGRRHWGVLPWGIRIAVILFFSVLIVCGSGLSLLFGREVLRVGGTGSALGSMKQLAHFFEKQHPEIVVRIVPSLGSAGAIKALSGQALEIAVLGRPPKPEEVQPGLVATEYGKSPFIFVTNRGVKIRDITSAEVAAMYRGDVVAWEDGTRVRLPLRPARDIDTAIAASMSPEVAKALQSAQPRPGMALALTDQENIDIIETTPGAFGFTALCLVVSEKRRVNVLSYNGISPEIHGIPNSAYPFSKRFFVATRKEPSPPVRKFLDFLWSSAGRRILEECGNTVLKK